MSNSEMSNFHSDQGRARVLVPAHRTGMRRFVGRTEKPQPPASLPARRAYRPKGRVYASERERRSGKNGHLWMDSS